MELACNELQKNLPPGIKYNTPKGGFFVWLELPEQVDTTELLKFALEKYQVNFIFGKR